MTVRARLPARRAVARLACAGAVQSRYGRAVSSPGSASRYQGVFGETLVELAERDSRVVGVTPAMPSGCSMNLLMQAMPSRCFDVGIAEGMP
ncbi:MAG: hypothetical protein ACLRMJ_04015 [Alistipes finegoldii]